MRQSPQPRTSERGQVQQVEQRQGAWARRVPVQNPDQVVTARQQVPRPKVAVGPAEGHTGEPLVKRRLEPDQDVTVARAHVWRERSDVVGEGSGRSTPGAGERAQSREEVE